MNKIKIAGWLVLGLVGAVMVMAGSGKVFGFAPQEIIEGLEQVGLTEEVLLIGIGEVITAVLLLVPRTSSLGVLLASSFWGGAIVTHMSQGESYLVPAAFLVMTWVGSFLRDGRLLDSFNDATTPATPGSD